MRCKFTSTFIAKILEMLRACAKLVFSAVVVMQTMYRSKISVEREMRAAVSSSTTRADVLPHSKQANALRYIKICEYSTCRPSFYFKQRISEVHAS